MVRGGGDVVYDADESEAADRQAHALEAIHRRLLRRRSCLPESTRRESVSGRGGGRNSAEWRMCVGMRAYEGLLVSLSCARHSGSNAVEAQLGTPSTQVPWGT
eukprot:1114612-Rhodomonas_salina.1